MDGMTSLTVLFIFDSLSGASSTFVKVSIYVYLVSIALLAVALHTFSMTFPLTTLKFPDCSKSSRFSRLVVTLLVVVLLLHGSMTRLC